MKAKNELEWMLSMVVWLLSKIKILEFSDSDVVCLKKVKENLQDLLKVEN